MKKRTKQTKCRRHTEEERLKIIEEYRASGMNQARFASHCGISATTLQNWLRKSHELRGNGPLGKLLPVKVLPGSGPDGLSSPGRSFTITLRSCRRLHVPTGFDPEEVRILVGILEEPC
jgi:transposase-like protein